MATWLVVACMISMYSIYVQRFQSEHSLILNTSTSTSKKIKIAADSASASVSEMVVNNISQRLLHRRYDAKTQIPVFWNCSNADTTTTTPTANSLPVVYSQKNKKNNKKKFIFVHIFKTAGSSMRTLLRYYGRTCRKSVAIVSRCSHVVVMAAPMRTTPTSVTATDKNAVWRDARHRSCGLESFDSYSSPNDDDDSNDVTLNTVPKSSSSSSSSRSFGNFQYDRARIIGGHLPLGAHSVREGNQRGRKSNHSESSTDSAPEFHSTTTNDYSYQYLTFVRDPLEKYVSGKLYMNRFRSNWTDEDAIQLIEKDISHLFRHGSEYEKYSSYLLTPNQQQEILMKNAKNKHSSEETVQWMQSNLLEFNVLVGVVERMNESFQLLQYVLDGARELDALFQQLQSSSSSTHSNSNSNSNSTTRTTSTSSLVRNKSKWSTKDLIAQLSDRNPEFISMAKAALRSEYQVYQFAVALHTLQYETLILNQK